jgi:hypothetical protein
MNITTVKELIKELLDMNLDAEINVSYEPIEEHNPDRFKNKKKLFFTRKEVKKLLKVQKEKCASRGTHIIDWDALQIDPPTIYKYINETPIEEF